MREQMNGYLIVRGWNIIKLGNGRRRQRPECAVSERWQGEGYVYPDLLMGYQNPALFRGPGIKVVSGRRKRAVEDVVKSWKRELGKSVVTVGL